MLSKELTVARDAAKEGGRIAKAYFANLATAGIEKKSSEFGGSLGLVTKADVEAEQAIIEIIRENFPDHQFMAEESQTTQIEAEHLWVIDPVDGTNNFANGIPHYAVSVAYYRDGVAQCGCLVNPELNDEFVCQRGNGAFYNGSRAKVNQHRQLSETLLGVGFYYDRGSRMRLTLAAIGDCFEHQVQGVRRIGAAALDIAYVGVGRYGGYFEFQLQPWDFAAARLFLEEAGGRITTCEGAELPLAKTSVLATNGYLHDGLLEIVRRHVV